MKKYFFFLALSALSTISFAQSEGQNLFVQDSLELISSQFKFTEGASVDKQGNVFFTDQPNDKIWKYGIDGKLSLYMDKSGRANGTYFDKKGNLIVCADENNQIWSIDKNKKIKVLFSDYEGKKVNGPNDIWLDAKGGIYFTDPYYQRDYWTRKSPEIQGQKVYYLPKGKKEAIIVTDDIVKPNGIVGTPDGKFLYVADMSANKTYRYSIGADARLADRQLFLNQHSDGMTLDSNGNIYVTGKGVNIYKPTGEKIGHIDIPEEWCGNICFGGKDKNMLFITASKSLYVIPTNAKGVE
ncbi:SMP-30/gluconolactonase/LRE family protein [Pedobacter sp. ISL-68]|uniref:SMP-30/gluconolactonase/LRE family protein n=1 Tax=unclassified Pedobacter TaxID=2628915 RepID=UPI001BECF0E4|nr:MULTISPECIES: SMP-30/gluconolactonase/LRE family protein [unclassified Pedobacter]MBT2561060.1 SMP-30/gluconolactonase/LRE family protein [Pedobacter sp. ISL-64]MBT2590449.1 SMP-30/gluconolactonase/LRE family protein [Pedobacter sp. ISL-68]